MDDLKLIYYITVVFNQDETIIYKKKQGRNEVLGVLYTNGIIYTHHDGDMKQNFKTP